MRFRLFGIGWTVRFSFAAVIAALFATDRTGMLSLSLAAVALHELGHIAASRLCGVRIISVDFSVCGVLIERSRRVTSTSADCFIAAAGVIMNLTAAAVLYFVYLLSGSFRALTVCAVMLLLAVFSLLPVRGLDGGDLLAVLLNRFFGERAASAVLTTLTLLAAAVLMFAGIRLALTGSLNITMLAAAVYISALTLLNIKKERACFG